MALPTFHRTPNVYIPPPPRGPLKLGTVVGDLQQLVPLNPANPVAILDTEVHSSSLNGFSTTITNTRKSEYGIWPNLIGLTAPGTMGGTRTGYASEDISEEALSINRVDTSIFNPSTDYINQTVRLPQIQAFLKATNHRCPIYLITGLKIAHGASGLITTTRRQGARLNGPSNRSALLPLSPDVGLHTRSTGQTSFETASDFVLGVRVTMIRISSLRNRGEVKSADEYTAGATLLDDDHWHDPLTGMEVRVVHDHYPAEGDNGSRVSCVLVQREQVAGLEPARWVLTEP